MRLDIGRRFLQMVWGDAEGWAFVARKARPEKKGDPFPYTSFRWPDDAGAVWAWMEEHGPTHGLFWVPVLRKDNELRSKNGVRYRWLWAEQDLPTPAVLEDDAWSPWVTASGRPQHHHIYQRLTHDLPADDWHKTSHALRDFMGAEVAQSDTRFVRIPGSMNRKQELGYAKQVRIIRKGTAIGLDAVTAAVDMHGCHRPTPGPSRRQRAAGTWTGRLPGGVRSWVDTDDVGQSYRLLYKVGRKCAEAGMTPEQVIELVNGSELHYAKLSSDPAYNLVRDMTRVMSR